MKKLPNCLDIPEGMDEGSILEACWELDRVRRYSRIPHLSINHAVVSIVCTIMADAGEASIPSWLKAQNQTTLDDFFQNG